MAGERQVLVCPPTFKSNLVITTEGMEMNYRMWDRGEVGNVTGDCGKGVQSKDSAEPRQEDNSKHVSEKPEASSGSTESLIARSLCCLKRGILLRDKQGWCWDISHTAWGVGALLKDIVISTVGSGRWFHISKDVQKMYFDT